MNVVRGFLTIPRLRNKLLFVLMILALFRLGSFIPAIGVDRDELAAQAQNLSGSSLLQFLSFFSGGAVNTISIFTMGLGPFIAASIIVQMGQKLYGPWKELAKDPGGHDKMTQYTRYITLAIAIAQSAAIVLFFARTGVLPSMDLGNGLMLTFSLTVGAMLLMWMGELITQRGFGQGISILIFAGIVVGIPSALEAFRAITPVDQVLTGLVILGVVVGVVFVYEGVRKIPIQYAKQVMAPGRSNAGARTFIPLQVNMAGVMPAIFASSLVFLPAVIFELTGYGQWFSTHLVRGSYTLIAFESVLIVFFTYFYTAIIFDPVDQADNLRKGGGYIPGVRPGRPTAVFLDRVVNRLTLPGAIFLAGLAALPSLAFRLLPQADSVFFLFGGTSLLIIVGVAIQTSKQAEAEYRVSSYEGMVLRHRGLSD